ncbi:MAG: hypothetical protein P8Y97_23045 [Candidatus Lokiarchaeota archaeon]
MVTKTQIKLNEALFFYQKMIDNIKIESDFDYYLNAFLSSARSVTFIIHQEPLKTNLDYIIKIPNDIGIKEGKDYEIKLFTEGGKNKKEQFFEGKEANSIIRMKSKVKILRTLKKSKQKINQNGEKVEKEIDLNEIKKNGYIKFRDRPKRFNDINKNILYFCEEYSMWLANIVEECGKFFNFKLKE